MKMSSLEQLELLAKELSEIIIITKELKEKELSLRMQAFDIMNKLINKKIIINKSLNTKYGIFTKSEGRKTTVITCKKYNKVEKELKILKKQAIDNKRFKINQGEDFLKFIGVKQYEDS